MKYKKKVRSVLSRTRRTARCVSLFIMGVVVLYADESRSLTFKPNYMSRNALCDVACVTFESSLQLLSCYVLSVW